MPSTNIFLFWSFNTNNIPFREYAYLLITNTNNILPIREYLLDNAIGLHLPFALTHVKCLIEH